MGVVAKDVGGRITWVCTCAMCGVCTCVMCVHVPCVVCACVMCVHVPCVVCVHVPCVMCVHVPCVISVYIPNTPRVMAAQEDQGSLYPPLQMWGWGTCSVSLTMGTSNMRTHMSKVYQQPDMVM